MPLLRAGGEAAAQAQAYVAQGFRILKVRVGLEPFALDVARVRAVREAVGDEISLAVDANQAWTVKQAIGRIHALERFGLDCVEQPVAARDLTGWPRSRAPWTRRSWPTRACTRWRTP